jgi:hypothetical protein
VTRTFEELYAEIERLPEGMTGEILEEGVVRVMSRPASATAARRVAASMRFPVSTPTCEGPAGGSRSKPRSASRKSAW